MRAGERPPSLPERAAAYFEMSGRAEFIVAALFFALMIAFRMLNMMRCRFDSDESQHLHVIWGWANGFVQYRDLCDNHMPLFQIALVPIYKLIGVRADILYWMRFVLLPVYCLAAWCTYRIGALCFSKRAGIWAVILTGLYPGYHYTSLEFRTDNVWAPLWLLTLVVLLGGAITLRRAALAGLLLGLCFGISMKTTLLLLSILTAGALTLFFVGRPRLGLSTAHLARCVMAFLACAAFVPATIMIAFAADGLWPQFRYWVFENNIVPGLRNHPAWWIWVFPILFPVVICAGRIIIRATPDPTIAFRRGFIFLLCGFYLAALWSFWSLVNRQDYLPSQPLTFIIYTGAAFAIVSHFIAADREGKRGFHPVPLLAAIVAVEFVITLALHPFWLDRSRDETDLLRATLELTEPGDFVIDEKGETVFRQRSFGPIWENCVRERIRRGLLVDNVAERCIETHTCVAVLGGGISLDASRFIWQNYLFVGKRLRVAGAWLRPSLENEKRSDFEVVIPASYKIISRSAVVTGTLDGQPYDGARFLKPGHHTFMQTSDEIGLALLWAQAVDRNFTPFNYSHPSPGI